MLLPIVVPILVLVLTTFFMIVGDSRVRKLPLARAAAVVLGCLAFVLGWLVAASIPWRSWIWGTQ